MMDLGWRDAVGDYHYSSRADAVVKLRGQRVSLSEVEALVAAVAGVTE